MRNNDWREHPIDCQKVADIAGVLFNAEWIKNNGSNIYYCKTHCMPRNIKHMPKTPFILLTSSSDSSVTDAIAQYLPKNIIKWFTNNNEALDERVETIPIGFVFNQQRTEYIINESHIMRDKQNLLYVNFTRHLACRAGLYEMFGKFPWVTMKGGESFNSVFPKEFYQDIAEHQYVLSPHGAGPDCHRTYEALALGSIPVVKWNLAYRHLLDMPVLFVNSWNEVTQKLLEDKYAELVAKFKEPSMQKLSMKYWKERILTCHLS